MTVMNRHSPQFKELVGRLQSGELTRAQAAEIYGINPMTLAKWLVRSKVGESTRTKAEGQLYGAAIEKLNSLDPAVAEALAEATQKVVDGVYPSCLAAHKDYPGVSLSTLTARVRKARVAKGLPIGRQGKAQTPPPVQTIPQTHQELEERLGFKVRLP